MQVKLIIDKITADKTTDITKVGPVTVNPTDEVYFTVVGGTTQGDLLTYPRNGTYRFKKGDKHTGIELFLRRLTLNTAIGVVIAVRDEDDAVVPAFIRAAEAAGLVLAGNLAGEKNLVGQALHAFAKEKVKKSAEEFFKSFSEDGDETIGMIDLVVTNDNGALRCEWTPIGSTAIIGDNVSSAVAFRASGGGSNYVMRLRVEELIESALLFYNQTSRQLALGFVGQDGTFYHEWTLEPGATGTWSHIAGSGNGAVLFYNQANRQLAAGVLKPDGSFQTVQVFDPGTSSAWSHIAGAGNGAVVFYNQANRQLATGVLKPDGSFQTVQVFDPGTSSAWSHIAGAGNGAVFFYNLADGRYATGILEANGNFRTVFDSEPGVTDSWSHVVDCGNGILFFYNRDNGRYATGILEANGNFRTAFDSEPGVTDFWSHIVGAGNGVVLFYNDANGKYATGWFQPDGSFFTAKESGAGAFAAWTHII